MVIGLEGPRHTRHTRYANLAKKKKKKIKFAEYPINELKTPWSEVHAPIPLDKIKLAFSIILHTIKTQLKRGDYP